MSLGYGNFSTVIQYDIYAMAESFVKSGSSWDKANFSKSSVYGLNLTGFEASTITTSLPYISYVDFGCLVGYYLSTFFYGY